MENSHKQQYHHTYHICHLVVHVNREVGNRMRVDSKIAELLYYNTMVNKDGINNIVKLLNVVFIYYVVYDNADCYSNYIAGISSSDSMKFVKKYMWRTLEKE